MPFQRKKPAGIGAKAPFPGFIEPALATSIERTPSGSRWIAGFALDEGKWDAIYLGRRKGKDIVYAGKVDNGFDKTSAADLQKRLRPLIRKTQPYATRIAHKGIWVEPRDTDDAAAEQWNSCFVVAEHMAQERSQDCP
jgi:hypothetical protein